MPENIEMFANEKLSKLKMINFVTENNFRAN